MSAKERGLMGENEQKRKRRGDKKEKEEHPS